MPAWKHGAENERFAEHLKPSKQKMATEVDSFGSETPDADLQASHASPTCRAR